MFRFDPAQEMARLQQQMNELFSGAGGAVHEYPAVNVWTGDEDIIVTAELPGISAEELEIDVHNDTVTIKGARKPLELSESAKPHRGEREFGQFARTLTLPFRVESQNVSASLKHGVLTLTLPKAEADKPRKIAVKAA
ncbi:MAG TPA: Hsp20/alpha crystallin family protein [Planctomycetota bacterium]|nr:Hsp20/alpha crystallin family protein [Planctomycetota bacterium]